MNDKAVADFCNIDIFTAGALPDHIYDFHLSIVSMNREAEASIAESRKSEAESQQQTQQSSRDAAYGRE